jgi:FMN phosphatase YigB (HAD superfamily)
MVTERLGLDGQQLAEFMGDIWREGEREQAVYGFEDLVDVIIYSHECGMSKPDPGIYALACERLQAEPAQLVFLDNYEPCVVGARQAGIHAVLYQDNAQAITDIGNLLAR